MWNHKTCKQQLFFRQQRQAHRIHLDKLNCIKSSLDNFNNQWSLHNKTNKQDIKRITFLQKSRLNQIEFENTALLNRIVHIKKLKKSSQQKFKFATFYNENIQNSLGRKRNRLLHCIQTQNQHIANRIDKIHPTLQRSAWQINQLNTTKYKNNICASRFAKPDYTKQANHFKLKKHNSFDHLRFTKFDIKNLPKLNKPSLNSKSNKSIHEIFLIK